VRHAYEADDFFEALFAWRPESSAPRATQASHQDICRTENGAEENAVFHLA
jgi:hypothetical protein